ncbi:flagellar biosynthesis anti-sigma factor FlgM [Bdellovibrio sp. 22V]|uniref:flagellar biosynthesis anti-sigma factor FlgM n=1 Tax=Bdellovibrio TaxID=958 RepID=UPI00254348CE|nr:flagellar biosynthesis anti-sigma factor FlgM [Bdellovibrio sp. 22V]WII70674.1 flagellar biosynthesis anti-sigma factor FlgM [Bdellovibrio sp. 22V]
MKITHNKVGQNLNLTDSARSDKAEGIKNKATGATNKADVLSSSTLGESSRVELSPRAQEAKRIKELATAAPDVDEAKVAKFRQLIDDGKYKIDAKAIADRMVDEHLEIK